MSYSSHQKIKFIPTKIHKTVATRAAPFGPDIHQIVCGWGFAPDPTVWGSLQRSPRPPSWIKGPTSKGSEGKGRGGVLLLTGGEVRRGKGGKRRGKGRGKGGRGWPDQSQTRCYGSAYTILNEASN